MNIVALFAGYGGLDLGLEGVFPEARVVCFCEIEPYAQRILEKRFPGVPIMEDAYDLQGYELAKRIPGGIQWITAGFPCQAFSHAGKRGGKDDPRGVLFWQIIRVAGEIREAQGRLPSLFLENVTGLLSMRNDDHTSVFGEMLLALHEVGYDARWGVLVPSAPAPLTGGNGFSSWHSPRSSDYKGAVSPHSAQGAIERMGQPTNLPENVVAVENHMWPTPKGSPSGPDFARADREADAEGIAPCGW